MFTSTNDVYQLDKDDPIGFSSEELVEMDQVSPNYTLDDLHMSEFRNEQTQD